jgi:MerR family transcriptional regulator, thiopeptide resistance regulator
MYTVSGLARRCGLSRTTLLYYESLGLLKPSSRSAGNYRQYGERELGRLRQICAYRNIGLSLADIRAVLGRPSNDAASTLQKRLVQIDAEVNRLRSHQRVILRLLGNTRFRRAEMMTKDRWVAIMRGCGFTDEQMERWHTEFERSAPDDHQEFLEFLHIPTEEIGRIREWSRKGEGK